MILWGGDAELSWSDWRLLTVKDNYSDDRATLKYPGKVSTKNLGVLFAAMAGRGGDVELTPSKGRCNPFQDRMLQRAEKMRRVSSPSAASESGGGLTAILDLLDTPAESCNVVHKPLASDSEEEQNEEQEEEHQQEQQDEAVITAPPWSVTVVDEAAFKPSPPSPDVVDAAA